MPNTNTPGASTARTPSITTAALVSKLLLELQSADQIILAMLNVMTPAQKSKVHSELVTVGVSGEGMVRHHERRAVIVAAETALAAPAVAAGQSNPNQGARDAVWAAEVGVSCIEGNIEPVMVAIHALADVDGLAFDAMKKRIEVIRKLARVGVIVTESMLNTLDCERAQMQDKLDALQGGAA